MKEKFPFSVKLWPLPSKIAYRKANIILKNMEITDTYLHNTNNRFYPQYRGNLSKRATPMDTRRMDRAYSSQSIQAEIRLRMSYRNVIQDIIHLLTRDVASHTPNDRTYQYWSNRL